MRENRPSLTALKVARVLYYLRRDPAIEPLLPRGAAEASERLLIAADLFPAWMRAVFDDPRARRLLGAMEAAIAPGTPLALGLRKSFFEDETRAAIAEGATQVVVLGAGFDTLGMRLSAEYPDQRFYEIDHPATQTRKREGLSRLGEERPNLHLLAVDLSHKTLENALDALPGFQRDELTVVLAEGLLMYLDREAISTLLDTIRRNTAKGSRLLFSYLKADEGGRLRLGKLGALSRLSFHLIGEPIRWTASREEELASFLSAHGYRVDTQSERCNLRRRYLEPVGLGERPWLDLEFMAVAETT